MIRVLVVTHTEQRDFQNAFSATIEYIYAKKWDYVDTVFKAYPVGYSTQYTAFVTYNDNT